MSLTEQVLHNARAMAQELAEENQALLEGVCAGAVSSLKNKLKEGVAPEDCLEAFVPAAAMLAVADMSQVGDMAAVEQLSAGDLTLRKAENNAAADCLRRQAQALMQPYLKTGFVFMGV